MGMGSSSSSADTGIQASGGNIYNNPPNYVAWIVIALVVLGLGYIYLKGKR